MVFSLIFASRKLHLSFQAQIIMVMTDQPIWKSMSKPDVVGRLVQWVIELSHFDIKYRPRASIKAQALADFIAKQNQAHAYIDCTIIMHIQTIKLI